MSRTTGPLGPALESVTARVLLSRGHGFSTCPNSNRIQPDRAMKLSHFPAVTFVLLVILGCSKTPDHPAFANDRRVLELEAKIIALEKQMTQPPQATPIPEDDGARLKRLLVHFPEKLGASKAQWKLLSYDINRTDSLVSPLVAIVFLDCLGGKNDVNYRYRVRLAAQDRSWVITKMDGAQYGYGKEPTEGRFPLPAEADDGDREKLQQYLR